MKRLALLGLLLFFGVAAFGGTVIGSSAAVRSFSQWMDSVRSLDDRPVSDDATPVSFAVRPGSTAAAVGADLQRAGLIRSTTAFRMQVELRDAGSHIAVGEYQLRQNMTIAEILDALTAGPTRKSTLVTIPEGWRSEEVAQYLETRGIVNAASFLEAVAGKDPSIDIPIPAGATSFEGYLFPDTYDFGRNPTNQSVLTTFLTEFSRRTTALRTNGIVAARATESAASLHRVITLASIVEREAIEPDERARIAAVFDNRLARGMPLQADPTVQYARIPFPAVSVSGYWKADLSVADLRLDSPYNTYLVRGLPPGPICNPGLASIEAAAYPADESSLYFVAKGDGSHLFAQTLDEHNRNVARVRGNSP
jgi:UPF0755 protein